MFIKMGNLLPALFITLLEIQIERVFITKENSKLRTISLTLIKKGFVSDVMQIVCKKKSSYIFIDIVTA